MILYLTDLRPLAPYTVYGFRVQAATDVGVGNFSNTTEFSTMESGIPSCIIILHREHTEHTKIFIHFNSM